MVWLVAEDMSKLSLLLGGKGSSAWTLQQTFLWRNHKEAQESVRELAANHPSSGVEHHCKHQVGWKTSWYFALNMESRVQQGKHKALKLVFSLLVKIFESILLFLPQNLFIYFFACGAWRVATDQRAVWLYKLFGKSLSRRSLQSDLCFVTRWKLICDVCAVWPACSITAGCVCVCVLLCAYLMQRRRSSSIFMWTKRCFVSVRCVNVYEVCFIWFLSVCEKRMDIYTPYQIYKGRVECVYRCLQQLKSK